MSVKFFKWATVLVAVTFVSLSFASFTPAADPVLPALGEEEEEPLLEYSDLGDCDCVDCGDCDCGDCGDCDCGDGCGDWREAAQAPGWNIGFEFVWVKPHYTDQAAYYTDTQQPFNTFQAHGFANGYKTTPRLYVGYAWDSGVGCRMSYWHYEHFTGVASATSTANNDTILARVQSTPFSATIETVGDQTLTASHNMQLRTLDMDVTQDFNWCRSTVVVIGGIRYARIEQRYNALIDVTWDDIDFLHSFEGVGPTFGIELKRRISDSRLSFFLGARGSLLFGDARQEISDIGRAGARGAEASRNQEIRTIADARLGVEYARTLGTCNDLLLRLAYEGQMWFSGGGPTNDGEDLGLEGFSFAMGLTR